MKTMNKKTITTKELKILEEEIRKVARASILQEVKSFNATRILKNAARSAVLDFEREIIKELNLITPDEMDDSSQAAYNEAMERMTTVVVNAVVDAVQAVEHLPRVQDEDSVQKPVTTNPVI